jgi:Ran GTPase-activating protein (RanGAP) involved in mRNA processing and transport
MSDSVAQQLGRSTTVTSLSLGRCVLSRENVLQLKAVLRRNTALESLDLTASTLWNAGLAEIAPVLYRNTSIKSLDLSYTGLDDIESANVLRELIRRNKTITSLCIARNAFGRNAAAVRSIVEGVRSNRTLQQVDLSGCALADRGISVLANALVARNASMLELNIGSNEITSLGVRTHLQEEFGGEAANSLYNVDGHCPTTAPCCCCSDRVVQSDLLDFDNRISFSE